MDSWLATTASVYRNQIGHLCSLVRNDIHVDGLSAVAPFGIQLC